MRTILVITTLLLATVAAATADAVDRLVLSQAQIDARLRAEPFIREAVLREKTSALPERIVKMRLDASVEPVRREKYLRDAAEVLAAYPRTPAAEAALRVLAGDAPIVFVLLDDGDHPGQTVPAFDPGAMARYALGFWVRSEARAATQLAFSSNTATLAPAFEADGEARLIAAGIADAVQAAEPAALRRNKSALAATLAAGYPIEDAVAAAALALGDATLAAQLLASGDPARTVHHLAAIVRTLPADAALDVLDGATRPELRSAVLQAMATLAGTEPRARNLLLATLADPRDGGSAAAALASLHDAALTPTLAQMARGAPATPDGRLAAKRATLALFLDGSPAARTALATLADDPRVGVDARRWLAAGDAR